MSAVQGDIFVIDGGLLGDSIRDTGGAAETVWILKGRRLVSGEQPASFSEEIILSQGKFIVTDDRYHFIFKDENEADFKGEPEEFSFFSGYCSDSFFTKLNNIAESAPELDEVIKPYKKTSSINAPVIITILILLAVGIGFTVYPNGSEIVVGPSEASVAVQDLDSLSGQPDLESEETSADTVKVSSYEELQAQIMVSEQTIKDASNDELSKALSECRSRVVDLEKSAFGRHIIDKYSADSHQYAAGWVAVETTEQRIVDAKKTGRLNAEYAIITGEESFSGNKQVVKHHRCTFSEDLTISSVH